MVDFWGEGCPAGLVKMVGTGEFALLLRGAT